MGKGIIRAGKIPHKKTKIIAGDKRQDVATINFSFRYFDVNNEKFCFTSQGASYFCKVLNRLKDLSTLTEHEFIADRSAALKSHSIDWRHTSEPDGFKHLNEQFQGYTPYQFAVSRNEHGRVHGFFIGNVFNVVWLDPDHRLYPEK